MRNQAIGHLASAHSYVEKFFPSIMLKKAVALPKRYNLKKNTSLKEFTNVMIMHACILLQTGTICMDIISHAHSRRNIKKRFKKKGRKVCMYCDKRIK